MAAIHNLTSLEEWTALWAAQNQGQSPHLLIFKRSPTCPVSLGAEEEFRAFVSSQPESERLKVCCVNVISARPVSQQIASDTGIRHESPQALLIGAEQKIVWHASHWEINASTLAQALKEM